MSRSLYRLSIVSYVLLFAPTFKSYQYVILFTVLTRATTRSDTYFDCVNKQLISNSIHTAQHLYIIFECQLTTSKFTVLQTKIVWNATVHFVLLDRQCVSANLQPCLNLQPHNYAPALNQALPANAIHRDSNAYRITADVFLPMNAPRATQHSVLIFVLPTRSQM